MNKPTPPEKDTLYAAQIDAISGFRFDNQVVSVFPDMIQRSVPGYSTIIHMIGQMAERYAKSGSRVYDLGCSLGAATLAMRHRIATSPVEIFAIDNSMAMIEQCEKVIQADSGLVPVHLACSDLRNTHIENASVVVLNFVLQFIPVQEREEILKKIVDGMQPGGILILSEKIAFEDEEHNQLMIDLHHNFKKANGYSDMEIAQKRTALENVLIPETLAVHKTRLLSAGFRSFDCWFQCFNFASMIALK